MTLSIGTAVRYTSRAGKTATYRVFWFGPDRYNAGKNRVGLLGNWPGAKKFFVDSETVTELYPLPEAVAA